MRPSEELEGCRSRCAPAHCRPSLNTTVCPRSPADLWIRATPRRSGSSAGGPLSIAEDDGPVPTDRGITDRSHDFTLRARMLGVSLADPPRLRCERRSPRRKADFPRYDLVHGQRREVVDPDESVTTIAGWMAGEPPRVQWSRDSAGLSPVAPVIERE